MWRTDLRSAIAIYFVCTFLIGHPITYAQRPSKKSAKPSPTQHIALTALDTVIDELRQVEDLSVRASMSEEIVKLLSATNPVRCRQMLDALFNDALRETKAASGIDTQDDQGAVVRKVIKIAAGYDRKLAENYIDRFTEEQKFADRETKVAEGNSFIQSELYLKLATELIEKDPLLAVSIAEKSLVSAVTPSALIFLETLRRKDIRLANNFLISALQAIKSRQGSNINELFLLYSYVFSPLRVPRVIPEGLVLQQISGYQDVVRDRSVEPELARQYLQRSLDIVLDPARLAAGIERLSAGPVGDLYFIQMIEPDVHTYLPLSTLAEKLSVQRNVLVSALDPSRREALQAAIDRWNSSRTENSLSTGGSSSTINSMLEKAEKIPDSPQKDQLYYTAATVAVKEKKYELALDIVDKMSKKFHDEAKQFITFSIAESQAESNELEEAERYAKRDSDLVRRAFILNLIATSLIKGESKNVGRASEILSEVEHLASKIALNREKISTLIGAAAVYSKFDDIRAYELLREAISIANKVEAFTGETRISRTLDVGDFAYVYYLYDEKLTFMEVINQQGRKDFNSIFSDIQSLQNRTARLRAIISLCRAVITTAPAVRVT